MASTKTNLPKRFAPFLDQARTQGALRYGAQETGLQGLFDDATQNYTRQSAAQEGAARSLLGSLASAGANLNTAYSDAGLTPEVRAQYANTPDGQRILASLARGQGDIQTQTLGAQAGRQYIQQRLADDYKSDTDKINSQGQAMATERGLYESSLLDQLIGSDRSMRHDANAASAKQAFDAQQAIDDRNSTRDNALIGQGLLPDAQGNLQPLPGGKADPNAKDPKKTNPWLDKGGQGSARSTISKAFAQAKRLKREGRDRGEAGSLLTEGRPGQQVVDSKGNKINIPGVPTYEELYASVALDLAYDGHISQRNVQELHGQGVKVNPLGYKTSGQVRRARRSAPHPGTTKTPGANGQYRPT